ncbi:Craniofacial development protein 1 [Coemansia sp. BCRC 34301]|nr:Craniofacial development protein 1 [Coemansia sp. BCRC 34301]
MSLLDLYKDDRDLSEDEESEDEFVPDQASEGDGGSNDDDSTDDEEADKVAAPGPDVEQQKRRVDAIWSEMNDTADSRGSKSARVDTVSSEALEIAPEKDADKGDTAPAKAAPVASDVVAPEQPRPAARHGGGPVRRASKFSQLAKAVESRRGKKENTLEQARKEWTGFVAAEGIREDLDQANKDGFVERQEFLRRTDERTYERSRQEHLKRK